jgi:hypothetical protein
MTTYVIYESVTGTAVDEEGNSVALGGYVSGMYAFFFLFLFLFTISPFQQTATLVEDASNLVETATDNAGDLAQESCTLSGRSVVCVATLYSDGGLLGAGTATLPAQYITTTFPATATSQASKSNANAIHATSSYKGTIIGCVEL